MLRGFLYLYIHCNVDSLGVQRAPPSCAYVHVPDRSGDLRPRGRKVDGLLQQRILHPCHHASGGQGTGKHYFYSKRIKTSAVIRDLD